MFAITKGKASGDFKSGNNDLFLLNRSGRYTALEGLRGVAVLMVFFVHLFANYDKPEFLSQTNPVISIVVKFLHSGQIGVDLFFVLSGFFIAISLFKRKPGFLEFMSKRFYRLLPAHIFVLLCLIFKNKIFDVYVILTNALFINIFLDNSRIINIVTWSLGYEVAFYTLYGIWNIVLRKMKILHSGYTLLLVFIAMWTAQWWGQPLVSYITAGTVKIPDMSRFIGFIFGIGIAKLYLTQKLQGRFAKIINLCVAPAILSLVLLQWYFDWGRLHKAIYFVMVGFSFSIVIASALTKNIHLNGLLNNKLLRFTGVISYSFYLVHPITIALAQLVKIATNVYISFGVHFILSSLLTYFVSSIMFLLLEKPYFTDKGHRQEVR